MISNQPQPFGDRLAALVEERESQLVLGLDPDPAKLWPSAVGAADSGSGENPAVTAARAVSAHCRAVISAVGGDCAGVKLQLACFERLGSAGWQALEDTVATAHEHGLLVIADGKRGDVPVSASVYGEALFGPVSTPWGETGGLAADAATANPLIGGDSLEPLLERAWARGGGVFALVRTSNPGAVDIEDLVVEGGGSVSDRIARMVGELGEHYVGESGLSSLGAVVGATAPQHIERLRSALPRAVFLIPGVGAQGGKVEDLAAAFSPARAAALVTVSRALVNAADTPGEDPVDAARAAAARLRAAIWAVSG
ncbi:MAG: orotidine-5'-phosphate decarboxylase [Actinobacteria bacterium]|nr:orotidine-5'-phosphate decarboxylase [Actinomycetota bacterium]